VPKKDATKANRNHFGTPRAKPASAKMKRGSLLSWTANAQSQRTGLGRLGLLVVSPLQIFFCALWQQS
jgi:hypothetical protein